MNDLCPFILLNNSELLLQNLVNFIVQSREKIEGEKRKRRPSPSTFEGLDCKKRHLRQSDAASYALTCGI